MNITQYSPLLADDLTVVVDGAETILIYQPDSGSLLTVPNCVAQTIKADKTPAESPQGATILEREWNAPLNNSECGMRNAELSSSSALRNSADRVGSQLEDCSAINACSEAKPCPTARAASRIIPNSELNNASRVAINDVIIDCHDQQWRIVSIERKERLGRVVYKAQRIDDQPRLDEWVDIITPIYQTDDNGAPYVYKYQLDLTGVSARIIRVPVSSHRQLTDVPEERIEIVFADNNLRISAQQRIRLADGSIYKPTDLFPITQTRPALRIIAQREAVGSRQ